MTAINHFYEALDTKLLENMRAGLVGEITVAGQAPEPRRRYAHMEGRVASIDQELRRRGLRYLLHLVPDGPDAITCLTCHRTSHNQGDVEHHYCGHCHVFHDDPVAAKGTT